MKWVAVSIAVHALLLLALIAPRSVPNAPASTPTRVVKIDAEPLTVVEIIEQTPAPAGHAGGGGARHASTPARVADDPWQHITIGREQEGQGQGQGQGHGGDGDGDGVGFGAVHVDDVPPPPPALAIKISKARPAKLIWPKRDEEVDDDANLFIANVTVDAEGDVVGARMVKTRPGAKADHAANAIWTFRYAPALDDDGNPVRSSFEQPFQVR